MTKRIFAVIGIVIGSALALAGAIVGIFAAMGKFKEPVVYPEALVFEQSSLMVDQDNPTLTLTSGKKIYSFVLSGTSSSDYEVNRKSCYISFSKGKGIITLCSKDGTPLAPSQTNGNQYLVNCNEPVYYFVNTEETTGEGEVSKVGEIVLSARDERGAVWGTNELTINVDSAIESVYINAPIGENGVLQNSPIHIVGEPATQNIEMSLGGKIYINAKDYVVKPSNTLKPFEDKDAKEIELYFVGPEKHYLVNAETLENDDELKQVLVDASGTTIIQYDENSGYYFTAMAPARYQFKIAYFPTYNEKEEFDGNPTNAELTGYYRVQEMQHTILSINVQNTVVDNVYINGAVNLNLFMNNNYLTIGGEKVVDNANNSVLGLTYSPANQQTALRYNEAIFMKNNMILGESIALKSSSNTIVSLVNAEVTKNGEVYSFVGGDAGREKTFTLTTSTSNHKTINYGYYETVNGQTKYHNRIVVAGVVDNESLTYTTDGLLIIESVFETDGTEKLVLKLLQAGTYLDFLVNEESSLNKWLNCEVDFYNREELTGKKTTWSVIAKEEATNIVLSVLVVNNNGSYCFETVQTSINAQELSVGNISFKNERVQNLTVNYDANYNADLSATGSYLNMAQIFEIPNNVTYQNAVLLTLKDVNSSYSFDVIESITYLDTSVQPYKEYVLVGYVDDSGKFVNRVRVNKNATKESTNVFVAQLKAGYQVSTEDYVTSCLNNECMFEVVKMFNQSAATITINVGYNISHLVNAQGGFNTDLVSIVYGGDGYQHSDLEDIDYVSFVESSNGTLSISIKPFLNDIDEPLDPQPDIVNVLDNIHIMLGNDAFKALFKTFPTNAKVVNVSDSGVNLTLEINGTLTENSLVQMTMEYNGKTIEMLPIKILSKTPTNVHFNYSYTQIEGEDEITINNNFMLSKTTDLEALNQNALNVEIGWQDGDYTYAWRHNGHLIGNTINLTGESCNFAIYPEYAVGTLSYSVLDFETKEESNKVLSIDENKNIIINCVGTCIIKVSSETTTLGFVKVEVVSDGNFTLSLPESPINTNQNNYQFNGGVYYYDADSNSQYESDKDVALDDKIEIVNISHPTNDKYKYNKTNNTLYYIGEDGSEVGVLTATLVGNTLKFARTSELNSSLNIAVELKTLTHGNQILEIYFNPSLAVDRMWKNLIVYEGTQIQLFHRAEVYTETTNAMFKIIDAQKNVNVFINDTEQSSINYTVPTLSTLNSTDGKLNLVFKKDGVQIHAATVQVVPNVMINITNTAFKAGNADRKMFEAYSYNLKDSSNQDIIYGGNTVGEYPSINSQNFETYTTKITSGFASSNANITFDNLANVNIPAEYIPEIDATKNEEITIKHNSADIPVSNIFENKASVQSNKIAITISSAYTLDDYVNSVEAVEDDLSTALEVKLNETSNFDITSISIEDKNGNNLTVEANKITTLVAEPTECEFVIKLEINSVEYTLTLNNVMVNPYVPLVKDGESVAEETKFIYSQSEYELIGRIFTIDSQISNITATKLIIGGREITDAQDTSYFNAFGFNGTENKANVETSRLEGDNAKIIVVFAITYAGDAGIYYYEHPLTIKNRDQFEPVLYPYADIKLSAGSQIKLVEVDFTKHAAGTLTNATFATIEGECNYEPVILGQTIDLSEKINVNGRVNVKDMVADSEEKIASVSIYAASNSSILSDYIYLDKQIKIDGTKISFGKETISGPLSFGYIQFKFTTTNGNVGYYNVRLYNQLDGDNSNIIDANSNQNIEYTVNGNNKFAITKDGDNYTLFGEVLDFENTFKMKSFDSKKVSMYLLNVISPAEVAENENGIQVGGATLLATAKYFQKINVEGSEIAVSAISNYATIKVALVYRSGNAEYCFGTLTIYVQPSAKETLTLELQNKLDKQSGFYTKTIDNNDAKFVSPFNSVKGAAFVQTNIGDYGVRIDESDYTLWFDKYVQEDLTFNVLYTINGGLLINVEYTLKAFNFAPQTQNVQVGKFLTSTKEFANYLSLTDILDGYSKAIKISINDDELVGGNGIIPGETLASPLEYEVTVSTGETDKISFTNNLADNRAFVFPLFSVGYEVKITLTFVGYRVDGVELTKTIKVSVLPGIYVENNTNATPVVSSVIDSYESEDGSKITFNQGANVYSINNTYFVYMAESGKLNITYTAESDGINYVNLLTTNPTFVIDGNGDSITFPHMTNDNKVVQLNVSFVYNDKPTTAHQGDSLILNVKLAKTYAGIHCNYLQSGSDNENVNYGNWGNIYECLFDSSSRILLLDEDEQILTSNFNFTKMGFNDETNPNFITYEPGENMVLDGGVLSFNAITASTESTLKIINKAGVNAEYKFFILKSSYSEVDGIDFNTDKVGEKNISFLVGGTEGQLSETVLGTLIDGNLKPELFNFKSAKYFVDGSEIDIEQYVSDEVGSENTYRDITNNPNYEEYKEYAKAYLIQTANHGKFVLLLDENKQVSILFDNVNATATFDKLELQLSVLGDTGYIFDDFSIILYNYVAPATSDLRSEILATKSLNVKDKIQFKNSAGENITNSNLTYNLTSASWDGKTYKVENGVLETNTLLTYNNGIVSTEHVPSTKTVKLVYEVWDNSYFITTIEFTLVIKNSIQYVVNGEDLDVNQTEFITDYELFNATPTNENIPLTQSLVYDSSTNNNILSFRLFYATQGITNFGSLPGTALSQVKISIKDGYNYYYYDGDVEKPIVEVNGTNLIFNRDLTTTSEKPLILIISHDTPNGVYEVEWLIDVVGIETFNYTRSANLIMEDSFGAFNSGTSVDLTLSTKNNTSIENNIYITETYKDGEDVKIEADVDYVLNKGLTAITDLNALFEDASKVKEDTRSSMSSRNLTTVLPTVPQDGEYVITYRMYFTYLGAKYGPYYASYRVVNNNNLESTATSVNVAATGSYMNETNLQLFTYSESYSVGANNVFDIKINEATSGSEKYEMNLVFGSETYKYISGSISGTSEWHYSETNKIQLKRGANANTYTYQKVAWGDSFATDAGTEVTRTVVNKIEGKTLIKVDYANIQEFVATLNEIQNIKFTGLSEENGYAGTGTEKSYTLKFENKNNIFYIDLSEGLGTDNKLFNNKLIANLEVCTQSTIFSIPNFELTTDTTISAKDSKPLSTIYSLGQLGEANDSFAGTPIIGVFDYTDAEGAQKDKMKEWINISSGAILTADVVQDIELVGEFVAIDNASVSGEHKLYQISYSYGVGTLYNVQETFYAIGTSTGNITLVDYATHSIYPNYFYVQYNGTDTLRFNESVVVTYSMGEDGKFIKTPKLNANSYAISKPDGVESSTTLVRKETTYTEYGLTVTIVWQVPDNW